MALIGMINLGNDQGRIPFKRKYEEAVNKAGADFEWIDWEYSVEYIEKMAAKFDGFLLPGGGDIDPCLFGAPKVEYADEPNKARDDFEIPFARYILEKTDKPVLGICKGCQLINVLYGGTLYQDLKIEYDGYKIDHSNSKRKAEGVHGISIAGEKLSQIVGEKNIYVNTMHHQAVRQVPSSLKVAAISEDGVVEAVEGKEERFILGVQWHPEHLEGECSDRIFKAFVKACEGR